MNNKKTLIAIYEKASKTGSLPNDGLCNTLNRVDLGLNLNNLKLFHPNENDREELEKEDKPIAYWGYEIPYDAKHSPNQKYCGCAQFIDY
jgi:hypothetical protein